MNPRPCSAIEAVARALLMVGKGRYVLGAGDYKPTVTADLPWTHSEHGYGSDCVGFAMAWCYKVPRERDGYNEGWWASVGGWLNTDSLIEQAEHMGRDRVVEIADRPMLGDLLVFPSIRAKTGKRLRIGHVGIVVGVPAEWDAAAPQYGTITVAQCQASSEPAVKKGPGSAWLFRDQFKGMRDDSWRTRILRVVQ